MAYQYRVEITLDDDSTEEIIIHSNSELEFVGDPMGDKKAAEITKLRATETSIVAWMIRNNAKKVEVTREAEA